MADRNRKGRQARLMGERHNMRKLNDEDVLSIVAMWKGGMKPTEVAKKFGVTKHAIYPIINGSGWTHITKGIL